MAGLGTLVVIPAAALIRGGGEPGGAAAGVQGEPAAVSPALDGRVRDGGLGIALRVPAGWRDAKRSSTVILRSRDNSARLAVAAPAPARRAGPVLADTLDAIRAGYRRVSVRPAGAGRLGGLPARNAVVAARTRDGVPLRILVAVARGDRRAYLVETFVAASAAPARLAEAQAALNSLRLRH